MRAKAIVVFMFLLFSVSSGLAGTEKVLYTFTGGLDGGQPYQAGVIFDQSGNLYGVTQYGGVYGEGTVFQLTPSPDGTWTETVLYNFIGAPDGAQPQAGLSIDGAGNLYGTASVEGPGSCGTVFELSPSESGWTYTILHAFTGGKDDGCIPLADLLLLDGVIYGTTIGGCANQGAVFQIRSGYNIGCFKGNAEMIPLGLGECATGICGNTFYGVKGCGSLFWLPGGVYPSNLHAFKYGGKFGCCPTGDLAFSWSDWSTYGTTSELGVGRSAGVVYRFVLNRRQTGYVFSVLHSFNNGTDGGGPWAGVILDAAGNLYGTTQWAGTPEGGGAGTVFKLTPGLNKHNKVIWNFTTLYSFTGGADGGNVTSPVVLDNAGNVYGTTTSGGAYNQGVVYEVTP